MTALASLGLKPLVIMKQEEFIFGDGKVDASDCAFIYPALLDGQFKGTIDMARVQVPCPALFSLKMAKAWDCMTYHAGEKLYIKKFDKEFPFVNGTPIVNILDYTEENLDLSTVPKEFFID